MLNEQEVKTNNRSDNTGLLPMDVDILPPTDDRIFKTILTSPEAKPLLIKLSSGIIGRKIIDVTVHPNELPVSDTQEKAERFDVNCKTNDGTQINLEMQASHIVEDLGGSHKNLISKGIYYMCDLHSSQPAKGQPRYDKLAQTYQIMFCSYTIFPNRNNYVNSFSMRHDEDNELLHDAIRSVYVELSKLEKILLKPVEVMTDLEKFSVFLEYAANPKYRDTVNKVIESEEVLTVASNLLMSISQDEVERARFRSRRKFQTDLASDLATTRDVARREERFEIIRNMIIDGEPSEKIVRYTKASREDVEAIRDELSILS